MFAIREPTLVDDEARVAFAARDRGHDLLEAQRHELELGARDHAEQQERRRVLTRNRDAASAQRREVLFSIARQALLVAALHDERAAREPERGARVEHGVVVHHARERRHAELGHIEPCIGIGRAAVERFDVVEQREPQTECLVADFVVQRGPEREGVVGTRRHAERQPPRQIAHASLSSSSWLTASCRLRTASFRSQPPRDRSPQRLDTARTCTSGTP